MVVVCSAMAAVGFVLQWKQPAAGCGFEAQPERSALLRALTAVQAPGTMLSVCAIVFSPSVANAVAMLQLSPSGADVVLCIAAVGLPAALAVDVCLQVLKLLASGDVVYDPHTTIAPRFPSAFYAQGGWRRALAPPVLAFCFFGTGGWVAPAVSRNRHGPSDDATSDDPLAVQFTLPIHRLTRASFPDTPTGGPSRFSQDSPRTTTVQLSPGSVRDGSSRSFLTSPTLSRKTPGGESSDLTPLTDVQCGQATMDCARVAWAAPLDPEPTALMKRVRLSFKSYRGDARATSGFYFVSMGAAIGSAIVRSVAVDCAIRQWVLFGWQLAYLALLLRLRPALVPIRRVLSCACSALTAVAFLLLGIHFTWEETPAAVLTAAEKLALATSVLSSAGAVLSILRFLLMKLHARLAPAGQTAAAFDAEAFGDETALEMGLAGLTFALSRALAPRPMDEIVIIPPPPPPPPLPVQPLPPPVVVPPVVVAPRLPSEPFSTDSSGDDDADVRRVTAVADARERFELLLL
jgi:hypothetical protein